MVYCLFYGKLECQAACVRSADRDVSTMQQHGILDNGQAEAGASRFTAAPLVNAIEALEDA